MHSSLFAGLAPFFGTGVHVYTTSKERVVTVSNHNLGASRYVEPSGSIVTYAHTHACTLHAMYTVQFIIIILLYSINLACKYRKSNNQIKLYWLYAE